MPNANSIEANLDTEYQQLAKELNGTYTPANPDRGRTYPRVQARIRDWDLVLVIELVGNGKPVHRPLTFVKACYKNDGGLKFNVRGGHWNNPVDEIINNIRFKKETPVGEANFDKHFAVYASDPTRIKAILTKPIETTLLALQDCWLQMDFAEGEYQLFFCELGIDVDRNRLKQIFNLVADTMDQIKKTAPALATSAKK